MPVEIKKKSSRVADARVGECGVMLTNGERICLIIFWIVGIALGVTILELFEGSESGTTVETKIAWILLGAILGHRKF